MSASRLVVIALLGLLGADALDRKPKRKARKAVETAPAEKDTHLEVDEEATSVPSFLMVSGYWQLDSTESLKYGPDGIPKSLSLVMSLNTPTAIYGDDFGLQQMHMAHPNKTAPAFVGVHKKDINSLEPCKTHGAMMQENAKHWTHPTDSPSINLGCIFDGKMGLLADASRKHPGYDFYAWVDVGTPQYNSDADVFKGHRNRPWPHPAKLAKLPLDKVSVAHSGNSDCDRMRDRPYEFWHCVSGTTFIVPAKLMGRINNMFYSTMNQCIDFWKDGHKHTLAREDNKKKWGGYACMSDSMLLSIMARDHPELFNWIGQGWTAAAANLTTSKTIF